MCGAEPTIGLASRFPGNARSARSPKLYCQGHDVQKPPLSFDQDCSPSKTTACPPSSNSPDTPQLRHLGERPAPLLRAMLSSWHDAAPWHPLSQSHPHLDARVPSFPLFSAMNAAYLYQVIWGDGCATYICRAALRFLRRKVSAPPRIPSLRKSPSTS